MGGREESLAASQLLDKNDPSLLTWREIKEAYGGCENFMLCHGLKAYNFEDYPEAIAISRSLKAQKENDVASKKNPSEN